MATNTKDSSLCTACDKNHGRLCGRCKSARYCSAECQKGDWDTHKLLCKSFSNFDVSTRETSEHLRAILFPVNESPKFIWLHCKWEDDDDDGRYQHPQTTSLLGAKACPRDIPIQYNTLLKRQLSDTIYICHRDAFLIDGSMPNQGVAAITSTKPGQYHDWRGPIIAYGKRGLGIDQRECRNLDMEDFRHVVDYFLSYDYKPVPATRQPIQARVKAVRINCLGDQKLYNRSPFEAIEILATHSIFTSHSTSGIANRIDLPIFTQRCPPDPKWADPKNSKKLGIHDPLNNQDATFLHLCCDPKADFDPSTGSFGWGWAPRPWQNDVGSVLVVRQDKKPLFPLHVEALCKYCRHEARAFLAHSNGEYSPEEPIERETALSMICRAAFVISWYKLLDQKSDREELETPYPYED